MSKRKWLAALHALDACIDAKRWVSSCEFGTFAEAFEKCPDITWVEYLTAELAKSGVGDWAAEAWAVYMGADDVHFRYMGCTRISRHREVREYFVQHLGKLEQWFNEFVAARCPEFEQWGGTYYKLQLILEKHRACEDACEWVYDSKFSTFAEAFAACPKIQWIDWLVMMSAQYGDSREATLLYMRGFGARHSERREEVLTQYYQPHCALIERLVNEYPLKEAR